MPVKRRMWRKDEGVASTIGMIFALSLVTLLMTTFITQYVPVYMKGNEAQHDYEVQSQMGYLRTVMDILALSENANFSTYVPITLGAEGVPGFSSPTIGQLSINTFLGPQSGHYVMVNFTDISGNNISSISGGSIEFIAPNKYYVPERMVLESGAFFVENMNKGTATLRMEPNFLILGNATQRTVVVNLYTIYGPSKATAGVETRFIKVMLYGTEHRQYGLPQGDVNVTIKSRYPDLWEDWFYSNYGISGTVSGDLLTLTIGNVTGVEIRNVYLYMEVSS